ncbi:hypothetical protein [Clostridium saccharoperbutylacetonicum]|jgi:hypothetical protein|uniref:hypothetical protein n=1 Tax=Clostridium saccharoperbutylacetonicum TaxID=36745 RepID=UPI000983C4F0|nr:hypothetical protein [Clostridium saccharoperbutylacetonicum]AQR95499.1 hypothetical protein CLSAP_28150 [Clostridium saccharoperbutylacetonicum]NSB31358.1 hypothetical protein [Clostridium saccharoperbutylacetonicum]
MNKIKTKYGILNGAIIASLYSTGEPEAYRIEEESELEILDTKLVPLYDFQNGRRKEFPALKVYKNGNIKSLALNNSTSINTSIGNYDVEKITFYEDGQINRIFFLDGKLSGYWTEDDEYNLSQAYNFDFKFSKFEAKIISMHFYKTQEIKSITLWPKERIKLNIGGDNFLGRIGISLYKSGELESCEPFRPIKINTPIGAIEAYDINALGIHGDSNSLKFNENGTLKALITSANTITITNKDGERILHAPKKIRLYSNSEILDTITLKLEFIKNKVIIDEQFEYRLEENKFEIGYLGEKKFTLNGDITNI